MRILREKLIKIDAKVAKHSRYVIFQMAEVTVSGTFFREILDRIRRLSLVGASVRPGRHMGLLKTGFKMEDNGLDVPK